MSEFTLPRDRSFSPRTWLVRLDMKAVILWGVVAVVAYLTLPPMATVLFASLQSDFLSRTTHFSLEHYAYYLTSPTAYRLLFNSLIYAGGTTIGAILAGGFLAWLYMRTDVPFKPFIFATAVLPFIIPGLLTTFSYVFLASPQIGLLNHGTQMAFGIRPFNIYSLPGMIFVQTLNLMPLTFAMLMGVFQSMDITLEESARTSGASNMRVMGSITLPLAVPGMVSASLLVFVDTISSFEVPNLIGVPGGIYVFVSQIYESLVGYPPDFGGAATLSTMVMVIAVAGITMSSRISRDGHRFATVTGKGFKPLPMSLGPWRWPALVLVLFFFLTGLVLPLAIMAWVSLLPGYEVPSAAALGRISLSNYVAILNYPRVLNSFGNSVIVTTSAAAVVMLITTIAAYITVKTRMPGRMVLDNLVFFPIAIPGTILGVSVLLWYLIAPLPFSLYGTLTILVIGFITLYLPYGMRFMVPALIQINSEMEEAAMTSGATWTRTLFSIYLPLLASPLLGGFLFIVILSFREVSASVFLFAQGTQLFSLTIYDLWGEGLFGYVSALGILMIAGFSILLVVAQRLLRRRPAS